jgi:hypothetical protein
VPSTRHLEELIMALDLTSTAAIFKNSVLSAVKEVTSKDLTSVAGFAQSQTQSLAQQAALVAGMIEANQFTPDEKDFYLDGLKQMTRGFVETVIQVIVVAIEEIYNAVIAAIYKTINSLTGLALAV